MTFQCPLENNRHIIEQDCDIYYVKINAIRTANDEDNLIYYYFFQR